MLSKVIRLAVMLAILFAMGGIQSCSTTGYHAFHKKKYKIRKNHPAVQTYYTKGSIFNKKY